MDIKEKIIGLLGSLIHPETGEDLVKSGFVEQVNASEEHISVALHFAKARDPFAFKLKAQAEELLREAFPDATVTVMLRKSTVTANLAVALRNMGYRVGVLDADIYGPSQPKMFGVEGYLPDAVQEDGIDQIVPAEAQGIELMSIGFFIKPTDALLWRGAMAVNALRQMIHQTRWGELDFLLTDLPPGTGDIHLSIIGELKIDAAVIVSTPQQVAVADVVRGVELFRNPQVNIPVAGIVENMAWFTPEELPDNRYYLFGKGGARRYAEQNGVDFLGEIPIVQSIMECSEEGRPAAGIDPRVEKWYRDIAGRIVEKVRK